MKHLSGILIFQIYLKVDVTTDYKNIDLESQDPIFNANLGQDENLIWTKKLRCSHSNSPWKF